MPALPASVDRDWFVVHPGARMNYAVPRLLDAHGRLQVVLTDFALDGPLATIAACLPRAPRRRLERYRLPIDPSRVDAIPMRTMLERLWHRPQRSLVHYHRWCLAQFRTYGQRVARLRSKFPVHHFYGFDTSSLESIADWPADGMVVIEQCVAPRSTQWKVWQRLPRSSTPLAVREPILRELHQREQAEWDRASLVIAPSNFVRSEMIAAGCQPDRIVVVPYGVPSVPEARVEEAIQQRRQRRSPCRVLFAGQFGYRKGAAELLQVAKQLEGKGIEFQVAGHWVDGLQPSQAPKNVLPLGHLSRDGLHDAFARADLFFLPSWLEGSATVLYDALSWGLPCVTTPNSGSVIEDGLHGAIVEAGQTEAMAQAILSLAQNAQSRHQKGLAARTLSLQYDLPHYGQRLIAAIEPKPVASAVDR
jgi:glycosyltransferase involved in cell wall biosynthesis